ncbi:hypothetical protein RQP46_000743 [Phenoliferia psychrophenolica]
MVTRSMTAYYQMGQDAPDYPKVSFYQLSQDTIVDDSLVNEHVDVQGNHREVIRTIGAASTVLLKNSNSTLPLSATAYRTLAVGWGSGSTNFPYIIGPFPAIQDRVHLENPQAVVEAVLSDYSPQAQAIARQDDVCIVFANADSGEGYITVDGNVGDRQNLTLWHDGDELIKNVTSECNNTIVVLHTVGPVIMEAWVDNPNVTAILYAGLPGQETGAAIVDILFGLVNPSGRLVQTIAKQRSDYGADVLYSSDMEVPQIVYSEELLIDYRWFDSRDIVPRFEFGFGLSYTEFEYSKLSVKPIASVPSRRTVELEKPKNAPGGFASLYEPAMNVTFSIRNSGKYPGNEVSQLYLGFPPAAGEPPKVLRGFERTFITNGSSEIVTILLNNKEISIWDVVTQAWVVPTGVFTVMIGQSSRIIKLTTTFTR